MHRFRVGDKQRPMVIVNVGAVGPQMLKDWATKDSQRPTVTAKLKAVGIAHEEMTNILKRVALMSPDEIAGSSSRILFV